MLNRRDYLRAGILSGSLALAGKPSQGRAQSGSRAQLGINLSGPADWNSELPFVDLFRMSRPWVSQSNGAPFGGGPPLNLNQYGWVNRLDPGAWAETLLCTDLLGHSPRGIHQVYYRGNGLLAFSNSAQLIDSSPGHCRINVDPLKGNAISLQIRQTDPKNPIRDIHVIAPGFEKTWQYAPFHPTFLARWKGFACLRFMDWMLTNGSDVKTWADRPTVNDATTSARGVPLETMIALCNQLRINPWFCMPHLADDNYVQQFAHLVRRTLSPSLKIYLEYSNELWNGSFPQSKYVGDQGVALGFGTADKPWEAGWRYTAYRSVQIFKIWENVFGGTGRLVRVLGSQSVNPYISDQILSFQNAWKNADALAIAPYLGFNVGQGDYATIANDIAGGDVNHLLDVFDSSAFPLAVQSMQKSKVVADKYGLKMVAYESGQHMLASTGDATLDGRISDLMNAANRHPRMGDIYKRYYDAWSAAGGDMMGVFASVAKWSIHGYWGLGEWYDQHASAIPKYEQTLQWAKQAGQNVSVD